MGAVSKCPNPAPHARASKRIKAQSDQNTGPTENTDPAQNTKPTQETDNSDQNVPPVQEEEVLSLRFEYNCTLRRVLNLYLCSSTTEETDDQGNSASASKLNSSKLRKPDLNNAKPLEVVINVNIPSLELKHYESKSALIK